MSVWIEIALFVRGSGALSSSAHLNSLLLLAPPYVPTPCLVSFGSFGILLYFVPFNCICILHHVFLKIVVHVYNGK